MSKKHKKSRNKSALKKINSANVIIQFLTSILTFAILIVQFIKLLLAE